MEGTRQRGDGGGDTAEGTRRWGHGGGDTAVETRQWRYGGAHADLIRTIADMSPIDVLYIPR